MTQSQKDKKCKINHFYCGLHLLVNFAEMAERETRETSDADKNDAVKFVRMACKCFAPGEKFKKKLNSRHNGKRKLGTS